MIVCCENFLGNPKYGSSFHNSASQCDDKVMKLLMQESHKIYLGHNYHNKKCVMWHYYF